MQVQRDVVHAGADAGGEQALDEGVAVDAGAVAQAQYIQVPGMRVARRRPRRRDNRQAGQRRVVQSGKFGAALLECARLLQLLQPERGGDVGQVVLEARRHDLVVPARHRGGEAVERIAAHAVQAHHARPRGQLGVARDQHAAFAGGDGLVGVEAEDGGVAGQRADQLAADRRRQRMGGVFDHLQPVALRDGQDGRHVGRQAGVVHRQDGLGAWRDRRLDGEAVDVQRDRVDVDQLHVGAEVAHHLGRGGEGVRGGDDLVAGADADALRAPGAARRWPS